MKKMETLFIVLATLCIGILLFGCALTEKYGSLRIPSGPGDKITIEKLLENWQKYHVYFAGVRIPTPSAVVFDPKDDDKKLVYHEWWVEVISKEELSDIIGWLSLGEFEPKLWKILGPDNQVYGYMYTAWSHAYIKVVDNKTLWLNEMTLPPTVPSENLIHMN